MTEDEGRQILSALTVRLGMVSGGILGGFAAYWIGAANTPEGEAMSAWPVAAGAAAGLAAAWAVLGWLAWKHRAAGVVTGAALTVAAVVALAVRFATRWG